MIEEYVQYLKERFEDLRCIKQRDWCGWDPTMNAVFASNEWWQQRTQENSSYKKFRHTGLKSEKELRIIFKDVMATGEDIFASSFTQPQAQEEDQEDVYRPTMDEEEGSGDSEEELFGANPRPISVIANASKNRAVALNEIKDASVEKVMTELLGLEEVQYDARLLSPMYKASDGQDLLGNICFTKREQVHTSLSLLAKR
ncbi:hypothetical protein K1719_005241 [Acacia pycnantha]|nr:hypothetical protein K1719_005241 [Acacia pycnantha]